MGTQMKVKYGRKFKQSDEFEKIQNQMPAILKEVEIERSILINAVGISETTHYRKMKLRRYSAEDIIKYMLAIVRIQNKNSIKEII